MQNIRLPAVAGYFYPANRDELKKLLKSLFQQAASGETKEERKVKGLILPHAGYVYSGVVAAKTLFYSQLSSTIILLGPSHTGLGAPFSVMTQGSWQTPLGEVPIAENLAKELVKSSKYFEEDRLAHMQEHSLEVMLPFLQNTLSKFRIVPIVISQASEEIYNGLAKELVNTIKALKIDDVTLIASSDMTHYETHDQAKKKDAYAIEAILKLDEKLLLKRVAEKNISICGIAPVSVALSALKKLKATKAELIQYQTSGEVSGDYSLVVGYAGIRIY